jgi:type I restriction enzyme, S subunit
MAGEWRDVLLEDLAAPVRNAIVGGPFGSDLVSSDYQPSGIPVIRGENLSNGRWVTGDFVFVSIKKAKKLEANTASTLDIVFTQRGANHYRQVAVVPANEQRRFVISQSQMKLTVNRQLADPIFVYYAFRAPEQQEYLQRNAIQTGVPHTNLSILRKTPLRIPSIETQSDIVRILGALDDKIELNRRMNETLEAMARALFKSWFVDFEPVRAKAEGRDPDPPEPIADLFPARFVDSELGEIPEGWGVSKLGGLTDYLNRGISPAYIEHGGILVLNQKCVRDGHVDQSKGRRHNGEARSVEGRLLKKGDVLVNSTGVGTLGRVAQVLRLEEDTIVDSHVTVVRADEKAVSWNYLGICLGSREEEIEALGEGSTGQTELSRSRLASLPILVPPPQVLAAFDEISIPVREHYAASEKEAYTLAAIRDALLPKLISGEIRVRDSQLLSAPVLAVAG